MFRSWDPSLLYFCVGNASVEGFVLVFARVRDRAGLISEAPAKTGSSHFVDVMCSTRNWP